MIGKSEREKRIKLKTFLDAAGAYTAYQLRTIDLEVCFKRWVLNSEYKENLLNPDGERMIILLDPPTDVNLSKFILGAFNKPYDKGIKFDTSNSGNMENCEDISPLLYKVGALNWKYFCSVCGNVKTAGMQVLISKQYKKLFYTEIAGFVSGAKALCKGNDPLNCIKAIRNRCWNVAYEDYLNSASYTYHQLYGIDCEALLDEAKADLGIVEGSDNDIYFELVRYHFYRSLVDTNNTYNRNIPVDSMRLYDKVGVLTGLLGADGYKSQPISLVRYIQNEENLDIGGSL